MNAIILAGGNSSRMYKDGYKIPKPLLEILGIPNIERTIILLNKFGIFDITILIQEKHKEQFVYLKNKYNCKIISNLKHYNTLYSMNDVVDIISDTFVIEGDVVLAKNIFLKSENSFYYTMKYPDCSEDEWHPVLINNNISEFEIGKFSEPCLFGVSYWSSKDSKILQTALRKFFTNENFKKSNLFWDDCVADILNDINIKTVEISPLDACEMNNGKEYQYAQEISERYYRNCKSFIEDNTCYCEKDSRSLLFVNDIERCKIWRQKLISHTNRIINCEDIIEDPKQLVFHEGEYPYMIRFSDSNQYIGYVNIAEASNYILLRQLYIDKEYRRKTIGKSILKHIITYCSLSNKELRVNVYDKNIENFYTSIGMKLYFKTFRLFHKEEK